MSQIYLSGVETQLERISKLGDPLERINSVIDWELFRPELQERTRKEDYSKGGRPPLDAVFMFKIVMLQHWNNISNDSAEYLINDRLSFQRFLGMEVGEKAPDANTIWLFKEKLGEDGMRAMFDTFGNLLEESGIVTHKGSIVDASFVDVPRQRNSREENKTIKEGGVPEEWLAPDPAGRHKLAQKDTDARRTKKGNETRFGYKDHVKAGKESKIITDFSATPANTRDSYGCLNRKYAHGKPKSDGTWSLFGADRERSCLKQLQELVGLVDGKDEELFGDSAYVGEELHKEIKEKNPDIKLKIHEKAYRNKPLTDEQKENNHKKSRTRARVEHVFGYMARFMNGISIRTVGIKRAMREICGMNLAYNIRRAVFLASAKNAAVS